MSIGYEGRETMKETKIMRFRMNRVSLTMVKTDLLRVILVQMIMYNATRAQSFISSHRQQLWPRQVTALQYQQLTHTITSDSLIREALIETCSCFSITMSVRDFTNRARVSLPASQPALYLFVKIHTCVGEITNVRIWKHAEMSGGVRKWLGSTL